MTKPKPCVLRIGFLNVRIFSKNPGIEADVIDWIRDRYVLFKTDHKPNLSVELEYAPRRDISREAVKIYETDDNPKAVIIRIKSRDEPPLYINVTKRLIKVRLFRDPEQRPKISQFASQFEIGIGLYILKRRSGFLLHASSVVKDRKALIFSGASGTGKSFMRAYLTKAQGYLPMNDDCTLVQPTDRGCFCFTTPFGTRNHRPTLNVRGKVKAVYFLKAAPRDRLVQESQDFCAEKMITHSFCARTTSMIGFISSEPAIISNYIDLAKEASSSIDCFCWERNRRATGSEISRYLATPAHRHGKGSHGNRKI